MKNVLTEKLEKGSNKNNVLFIDARTKVNFNKRNYSLGDYAINKKLCGLA